MSGYSDGYRLECHARTYLTAQGYEVFRSAGSKGTADLICFKPGEVLFVQAKKADGNIGPDARLALLDLACMLGGTTAARAIVACWIKDGRAARQLQLWELTGAGPRDRQPWTPDTVMETSA